MEGDVEIVEYVNNEGVITKMTANGQILPLPMGDKPSYAVFEPFPNGWAMKTYYMSHQEYKNFYKLIG